MDKEEEMEEEGDRGDGGEAEGEGKEWEKKGEEEEESEVGACATLQREGHANDAAVNTTEKLPVQLTGNCGAKTLPVPHNQLVFQGPTANTLRPWEPERHKSAGVTWLHVPLTL